MVSQPSLMPLSFKKILLNKLHQANITEETLLKKMGYKNLSQATFERLFKTLADDYLGLTKSYYDYTYSSEEFLRRLCQAIGLDKSLIDEFVTKTKHYFTEEYLAFKPYIFIKTDFKLREERVFMLAAIYNRLYLTFPNGFWRKSHTQKLLEAQEKARNFMAETRGKIAIWGNAQYFYYYYAKDKALVLDVDGSIVGERHQGVPIQVSTSLVPSA